MAGAPPKKGAKATKQLEKLCARCARPMQWRAKWRNNWEEVRYCSAACKRGPDPQAPALRQEILRQLQARAAQATLCPSEAALAVFGPKASWPQDAMQRVRAVSRQLDAEGRIETCQRGQVVDASRAKGPIRLRLVRRP